MDNTRLIALDWGTTTLRAYRIDAVGSMLERVSRPYGILNVPNGDFDGVFAKTLEPWRDAAPDVPAIACGMIGSRQGWAEAPYVGEPAGAAELARALIPVESRTGRRLLIVPGVVRVDAADVPDVMRGEETQIVGAGGNGLVLLPGTHSKWAWVAEGRVVWFATFMTGELYGLLCSHSILGRLMATDAASDDGAFARGLEAAQRMGPDTGGLLHRLFSVRTLGLFEQMDPAALPSYLSGLLIGAEIREAVGCVAGRLGHRPDRVRVIADDDLAARYAVGVDRVGMTAECMGEAAAVAGLYRIAKAAGLL